MWSYQNFRWPYFVNIIGFSSVFILRLSYCCFVYQGHGNPLDGIPSTVKAALTRAYKDENKSRMVRAADLVALPGKKKALKKRVAAILEPTDDGLREENGDALAESEEENSSDTEDMGKCLSFLGIIRPSNDGRQLSLLELGILSKVGKTID